MTRQSSLAPASPHPLSLPAPYPGTWPVPRVAPSPACALPGLSGHLHRGNTVRVVASPTRHRLVPTGCSITGALQPPGTHLAWAEGWRQETVRGGCSGGSRPLRAQLWHPESSWHQEGPLQWQLGLGAGSHGAASPQSKERQRERGQAGQWCGAMPLLWGAPSQAAWGIQGGTGCSGGEHSVLRRPQWQGWGTRAVLAVPRLEGRVGHAAGGCSQRASWPGGRRAAGKQARLQGQARRSFQRGGWLQGRVGWSFPRG